MPNDRNQVSLHVYARFGGLLYLIVIILGAAQELVVRGKIIVSGDATATAVNLRSMESLWRLGIASEMISLICTIVFAWIMYILLKPVNKNLALLAAFFSIIAISVEAAASLQLSNALLPLRESSYLVAFSTAQLDALSSLAIKQHGSDFGIALLLFGCYFPISAYLIFRSGFFPKTLGVLYLIPGLSYLTSSFAIILAPVFASQYYFVIAGPAIIGESALCLWLLFKGIYHDQWKLRAIESV